MARHLELLSKAADAIAEGDIISRFVNTYVSFSASVPYAVLSLTHHLPRLHPSVRSQDYSLLPSHGVTSTVMPSFFVHGYMGGRYEFAGYASSADDPTFVDNLNLPID